jgi:hypothetical protein
LGTTLGGLYEKGLLKSCVQLLGVNLGHFLRPVVDVLFEALGSKQYPPEAHHEDAVLLVGQTLVGLRPAFDRAAANDWPMCQAISFLCSQLGEQEVEWLGKGSELALQVVGLLLACAAHPDRGVCETTLDVFLALQDLETQQRHPQLRQPTFLQLSKVGG